MSYYLVKGGMKMPSQNQKKAKTININLTEAEYEKVKQLAEIRNLNPTAYTRLVALGNRIKPTVVEMPSNQMTIDTNEDVEDLKSQVQSNAYYANMFKRFASYIEDDRFYINLHEVQSDRELIQAIHQVKKEQ
ncbi:hypothetical protein KJB80_12130 [Staphylococcus cohnii]|uniref:plasmid mobilization protein n=2 Tax=Staphylococcus TaxID=1279 RepID=UPI000E682819|nr:MULTISPECIES: hypothetical protein [Staphylococcus]MCE5100582.1 hypothetical protein [Staphylococcus cohnii]RIO43802.1 hypothetical protein BUZ60_04035 [Staphylococcus nepalensis]